MSELKNKVSYQLLYTLSQLAFPIISIPYLAKTIGPDGVGKIAYIEYVTGFIISIAAFGIPMYGVREIAKLQHDKLATKKLFGKLLTIHLITSVFGILCFLCFCYFKAEEVNRHLTFLGVLNIILPILIAEWYIQGKESFKVIAVRNIVIRFIALLLMFLFIKNESDYATYYSIVVGGSVLIAFSSLKIIGLDAFRLSSLSVLPPTVKQLVFFFLVSGFIGFYVFLDVIFLSWFADDKALGIYTAALKIIKLMLFVVIAINAVLFPRISTLLSVGDIQIAKGLINKAFELIIFISLPSSLGIFLLAPQIIFFLFGESFVDAIPVLRIFSGLPLIIGLSNLFLYQILIPIQKEKLLLRIVALITFFCIILNMILTPIHLELGTAIATVGTEIIAMVIMGVAGYRNLPFSVNAKFIFQAIVSLIPLFFIILLAKDLFEHVTVILLVGGILGLMSYLIWHLFFFKTRPAVSLYNYLGGKIL